jgi:hypothetical protein
VTGIVLTLCLYFPRNWLVVVFVLSFKHATIRSLMYTSNATEVSVLSDTCLRQSIPILVVVIIVKITITIFDYTAPYNYNLFANVCASIHTPDLTCYCEKENKWIWIGFCHGMWRISINTLMVTNLRYNICLESGNQSWKIITSFLIIFRSTIFKSDAYGLT